MKLPYLLLVTTFAAPLSICQGAIVVTNGIFTESNGPTTNGDGEGNINQWFDSNDNTNAGGNTTSYNSWHFGAGTLANNLEGFGTNPVLVLRGGANHYAYQSIGTLDSGDTSLEWSLNTNDLGPTGQYTLSFFQGAFAGAADGTNLIGATGQPVLIPGGAFVFGADDTFSYSNSLDVSGIAAGTEIWMHITQSTGGFNRVDNVVVTAVPEPSSTALLGLGGLVLILRRRK